MNNVTVVAVSFEQDRNSKGSKTPLHPPSKGVKNDALILQECSKCNLKPGLCVIGQVFWGWTVFFPGGSDPHQYSVSFCEITDQTHNFTVTPDQ